MLRNKLVNRQLPEVERRVRQTRNLCRCNPHYTTRATRIEAAVPCEYDCVNGTDNMTGLSKQCAMRMIAVTAEGSPFASPTVYLRVLVSCGATSSHNDPR